ncbi:hypothetical protein Tco_0919154 [Tanacetum coccineum]
MEKLVLALVFAAKRLRRYFQAHPIAVIIDQPIKQIISRPDVAGRLQKWSVMLGEHNITYRPRTYVKGQILADFLVEKPDEAPPDTFAHLSKQVLVEVLKKKSIQEEEVATVVEEEGPTWMTPIIEYLKDGALPHDRKEASKLRIKARQYELLEGVLYRRSFLKPWLRCVGPLQADYVIREINEGSCSMHAGPWAVVAKAMRLGYYWPTMHRDARDMIRTCMMSNKYWSFPGRTKKGQVFNSRYGLFHEVDKGESCGDNHWQSGEEVRMRQHSMPLRTPRRNSFKQCPMDSWKEQTEAWVKEHNTDRTKKLEKR